jgi:hypothetical protein
MTTILAQMRGDPVRARLDREFGRTHRIRVVPCPRVAQRGDVIDIDAEAQRGSGHR